LFEIVSVTGPAMDHTVGFRASQIPRVILDIPDEVQVPELDDAARGQRRRAPGSETLIGLCEFVDDDLRIE
jgi:hypothetical protein